jgi:putative oxidoreductase
MPPPPSAEGMQAVNIAALLIRLIVGITMIAHGWNHAFGGGRIAGTARWFASIGVRPAMLNALAATATELGAGTLLVLGLVRPLAAAAVIGTMLVALVTNHLRNGFFIFRPGEGYEYVLMIIVVSCAAGALGGGQWSVDHLIGIDSQIGGIQLSGWVGLVVAAGLGLITGTRTVAACWRPGPPARGSTPVPETHAAAAADNAAD